MTYTKKIFRKATIIPVLLAIGFMFTTPMLLDVAAAPGGNGNKNGGVPDSALLPDIIPSIPKHLQVQNTQQSETLRFTNAWGNTGNGNLEFYPVIPGVDVPITETQDALQNLYDASGNLVWSDTVSHFEFHPAHNHWHIGNIGLFAVRESTPNGPGDIVVLPDGVTASSIKVGFCIIDVYKINGDNAPTGERTYWDCEVTEQGIQAGWMDQYHQSVEGNEVPITNLAPGEYYLTTEWNPVGSFIDEDDTNDQSWMKFDLTRDSNGNAKITEIDGFSPGGEISRNN